MDVSTIISKSRTQTWMTAGQKSDTLILTDLNTVYKDVFSRLATKNKKYARQTYKTTPIVGQNEYQIPERDTIQTGLKRLLQVSIVYETGQDPINCEIVDSSKPIDSLYLDYEKPYVIERDGSIFLYPTPTQAVTNWLVVEWQYVPLDLESTTESSQIKLEDEYHYILLYGLNMWNWWDKQLLDKEQLARQSYELAIAKMVDEWGEDIDWGTETTNADIDEVSQNFLP